MVVAGLSLVFLAILFPFGAFVYAFAGAIGGAGSDSGAAVTLGMVSGFLAVAGGIVAASNSRRAGVKTVATLSIVIGLLTGGTHMFFIASAPRTAVVEEEPYVQPNCGQASNPVVIDGDERYTPCPDHVKRGEDFAAQLLPQLPDSDVSIAAVDEVAARHADEPDYGGTSQTEEGFVAFWVPAPVTCAIFEWNGHSWHSQVTGQMPDGGCVSARG